MTPVSLTLPCGLQSLTVDSSFNEFGEVDSAKRPASLSFDANLNRRLELGEVTLPCGLQSSTFGASFSPSLEKLTLPCGMQSWTFDSSLNRCLEKLALTCGLQSLTVDASINEFGEVDSAKLPAEFDL